MIIRIQIIALMLFTNFVFGQIPVSVPFNEGFVGRQKTNKNSVDNYLIFTNSALNIQKAYFVQYVSSGNVFVAQGNDIIGFVKFEFTNGKTLEIPGYINWQEKSGSKTLLLGFIPANTTRINLRDYNNSSSDYFIDGSSGGGSIPTDISNNIYTANFGLKYNNQALTLTDDGNISGSADKPDIDDLNNYLTSISNLNPLGPVTVNSLTTSDTTPTITGNVTLRVGENFKVQVNNTTYYDSGSDLSISGNTWTLNIPTATPVDTYDVFAIITNPDGYIISDSTVDELQITATDTTDPVILDQTFTYAENQAANYAIGTVSATDSNTLTYAFDTGENTDGYFAINSSTGAITLTNVGSTSSAASNDYETTPNSFSLVVKVTDPSSNTATGTITINVTDVDDTDPVILDQTFTYAENQAANYAIGTVSATDSNTLTYAFDTGENTDGYFAINSSTGAITLTNVGSTSSAASNDYETTPNSFSLVVKVTDPSSNTATGTITINVTDVDDTDPVILDQTFTYAENQAANYAIGTVSATDSNTLTYAFDTGENTDGYFAINSSTGAITLTNVGSTSSAASNNYETTPNSFSLVVKVTDPSSNTATGTITINVTEVDTTDPVILDQTFTYAENQAANYAIGTVSATDSNTLTYAFDTGENTDGYFAINSSTGAITLTNVGSTSSAASNDYETTPNSFSLVVKVTDPSSNTATGTITINVTDVDDTDPVILDQTFTYAENQAANYAIGTVSATDSNTLTYAFDTGENTDGYFAINSSTGAITLTNVGSTSSAASNDYETTPNSFSLVVKVTDPSSNTATGTITINVTDVDDTDPVILDQTFTYAENQAANYAIGTVSATDSNTLTYAFDTGENTDGYFAINSSTGAITLTNVGSTSSAASNDYETTPNSFSLVVKVTDPSSNTATGTITINVTEVDTTDPVILDQTFTYAENQAANYAIGTVSATDSNTLTYAFDTGENTDGYFAINSSTGAITLTNVGSTSSAASNNYETTPNSFSLVVKVTDPSSNTATGTITINVTDVSEITFGITPGQVFSYAENQAADYAIGTVTATDYIGGVTFSISSGNIAGYFALSSDGALTLTSTGAGVVASNDFETMPNSFTLGISATDTTSSTVSGNVTINVTDIDEITDTDGDGVPDSIELSDGTDPTDGCSYVSSSVSLSQSIAWEALDCDADGLTNGEEKDLGTNPKIKDTDGDGVLDGTEVTDTTDPLDPCDYLAISITEERTSQWLNADCDKDGLTNGEEIDLGTDPFDADTDGDGVLDGTEVTDGTNPLDVCDYVSAHITQVQKEAWLNADCDKDGLTNEKEKDLGTDPFNADTDGDGVLDGTEVTDGTDPLDLCDFILSHQTLNPSDEWNAADCDEDGLSNKEEKELGTHPKNPDTDGMVF
jgi:hypothetical protein